MRMAILALLALCCAVAASAEDFAKDFERLYQFGLPDVAGARRLQATISSRDGAIRLDGRPAGEDNMVWLSREDAAGNVELLLFESWRVKAAKQGQPVYGAVALKTWRKVDFKEELQGLVKEYEAVLVNPAQHPRAAAKAPGLFLLAAQAWRLGLKEEAGHLAGLLRGLGGGHDEVFAAALGQLALGQYCETCYRFRQDGDLATLARDIRALLAKCPRGWICSPALERQLAGVERKLKGDVAEPFGEGLGDSDRSWARELADARGDAIQPLGFWLFPSVRGGLPPVLPPVMDKLRQHGVGYVPVLLALCDDPCLTGLSRQMNVQEMFFTANAMALSPQDRYYYGGELELPGLASRGETARLLLAPLFPNLGNAKPPRFDAKTPGVLRRWWRENQGKNLRQLAFAYLGRGDGGQRLAALRFLLDDSETEEKMAEVEMALAAALATGLDNWCLVVEFAARRGAKAKKLVAAYEDGLAAGAWRERGGRDVSAYLDKLTSTPDVDTLVAKLLSGGCKWDDPLWKSLERTLEFERDPVGFMLEKAAGTDDLGLRIKLLERLCFHHEGAGPRFGDHAASWRQLLAGHMADADYRRRLGSLIVSRYASRENALLEQMVASCGRAHAREQELAEAIVRNGQDFQEGRYLALARRVALAKALGEVEPGAFGAFADRLPVEELLAVDGILAHDQRLNSRFLPQANTIRALWASSELGDKFAALTPLRGQRLSAEICRSLHQALLSKHLPTARCEVRRPGCLEGASVVLVAGGQPINDGSKERNGFNVVGRLFLGSGEECYSVLATFSVVSREGKESLVPADLGKAPASPPGFFWDKVGAAFSTAPASSFIDLSFWLEWTHVE